MSYRCRDVRARFSRFFGASLTRLALSPVSPEWPIAAGPVARRQSPQRASDLQHPPCTPIALAGSLQQISAWRSRRGPTRACCRPYTPLSPQPVRASVLCVVAAAVTAIHPE
jgi:hypothetical protein